MCHQIYLGGRKYTLTPHPDNLYVWETLYFTYCL